MMMTRASFLGEIDNLMGMLIFGRRLRDMVRSGEVNTQEILDFYALVLDHAAAYVTSARISEGSGYPPEVSPEDVAHVAMATTRVNLALIASLRGKIVPVSLIESMEQLFSMEDGDGHTGQTEDQSRH